MFANKLVMPARNKLSKQPARIIVIHLSGTEDRSLFQKLITALENFFLLVCRMSGTVRVPYFGIVVISNQYKVLLPLQPVKGNFLKITMALSKLQWSLEDTTVACRSSNDIDLVGIGIQESVCLYYKQSQHLSFPSQLELIIFTSQQQKHVVSSVKNAASQLDFQHIRKIQTVFFNMIQNSNTEILPFSSCIDKNNDSTFWPDDPEPCGFVETILLEPTISSMHSFLMSWLHATDTDAEFLKIKFGSGFTIKCDVVERMVNPLCLHATHKTLDLSTDLLETGQTSSHSSVVMETNGGYDDDDDLEDGVHVIEVVAMVEVSNVCDSLLFGNPLILKATSCWKLEWDELETNQQHFQALCLHLNSMNKAMVVKLQKNNKNSRNRKFSPKHFTVNRKNAQKSNRLVTDFLSPSRSSSSFQPHYVILPSPSCSLLLKPMATSELLIPVDASSLAGCGENSQQALEVELASVVTLPMYDPFSVTSNLFESLKSSMNQNDDDDNSFGDDVIRSLPPAPKMYQESDNSIRTNKSKNGKSAGNHRNRIVQQPDPPSSSIKKKQQPTSTCPPTASTRLQKTSNKRKLYDPDASGLNFPNEL